MSRRWVAVIMVIAFALCIAGAAFAAETKGTVTKVEKGVITYKDAAGKEASIKGDTSKVKVGDMITIKDGKITKVETPKKEEAPKKEAPKTSGY